MTVYDLPPTRDFFAAKLHSLLVSKRKSEASNRIPINTVLGGIVRVVLHLAGFSLLTLAGFQFNTLAGLVVAGISCFALSTLMTRSIDGGEHDVKRAPDLRTGR